MRTPAWCMAYLFALQLLSQCIDSILQPNALPLGSPAPWELSTAAHRVSYCLPLNLFLKARQVLIVGRYL